MYGEVKQIKQMVNDMQRGIHTCIPGKITSVNSRNNTVCVQPSGKYKKPDGTHMDYPKLNDIPLILMQGTNQDVTITYPIKPGDGCMIYFSEQQLDQWRDNQEPKCELRHDLTNAIAVPGLFNTPNDVFRDACDNNAIIIQYKQDSKFTMKEKSIEVKQKDGTITMKDDKITLKQNDTTVVLDQNDISMKANKVKIDADVEVKGGIDVTKNVSTPIATLNTHVHLCTAPGTPSSNGMSPEAAAAAAQALIDNAVSNAEGSASEAGGT
jgi:phage gp45-like